MSYRFLDGTPVNAAVDRAQTVPVTILPQHTIICDGCGFAMKADAYVKGSNGTHFLCGTRGCEHNGQAIFIPYERISIAVSESRDI